jgi:hypothetical protein
MEIMDHGRLGALMGLQPAPHEACYNLHSKG